MVRTPGEGVHCTGILTIVLTLAGMIPVWLSNMSVSGTKFTAWRKVSKIGDDGGQEKTPEAGQASEMRKEPPHPPKNKVQVPASPKSTRITSICIYICIGNKKKNTVHTVYNYRIIQNCTYLCSSVALTFSAGP